MSVRMLKFKVTPYGTFESGQVVAGLPSHLEYQLMESGDAVPAEVKDFAATVAVEAIAVADISRNPDGTVSGYTYGGASYAVTYGPFGVESITGGGRTITVAYDASGRVEEITNV